MKILPRNLLDKIDVLFPRKEAIAILGPRRAGKTTLLKHLQEKKGGVYVSFTDPALANTFVKNPVEFIKHLNSDVVYLDEIQYLGSESGRLIKHVYDSLEGEVKLVISGSGAFHIKTGLSASMVGRVFYLELFPLSFDEFLQWTDALAYKFYTRHKLHVKSPHITQPNELLENRLHEFLMYGGYPEAVLSPSHLKKEYLKNILRTSVEEDIIKYFSLKEGKKLWKILAQLAALTGNLLKVSELGNYHTVTQYLSILQHSYLIQLIRPFHKNMNTELRKPEKPYFIDNGLRNVFLGESMLRFSGASLENFIFTQLLKKGETVKYWRTKSKAEVDFIIEKDGMPIPIEVKSGRGKMTRSLLSFIQKYEPEFSFVVGRSPWEKQVGNTHVFCIPAYYF